MKTLRTFLIGCGMAWALIPRAQAQRWNYSDDSLANGLRVITMEDHSAPIVAIQVWYHVGSKDEQPDRTGFAHMFEHMMFRGTDRIGPEDHFKYLRRYGGAVNGYTTFDQTVYIQEVPPNQVDLTFWLEAERMANLKINEEYFAKEREVVKEEYRLRVSDPPYGHVFENVLDTAFTQHPYRWSTIGDLDHLNAATVDELRAFFDTYYVPNNATLIVVGDVQRDAILEKARKYFGWIPKAPDPPRVSTREPAVSEPRQKEIYDKGPITLAGIGFHAPSLRDPDRHALDVLDKVLSGESGRVYRKLVKEQEISVGAQSMYFALEQHGIWGIGSAVKPFGSVEANLEALREILAEIRRAGITDDELEKARNQVAAEAALAGATNAGKARRLGLAAVVQGDIELVNREFDTLMRITADDVQRVARTYLADERRMTLIVKPKIAKLGNLLNVFKRGQKKESDSDGKDGKDND